MKSVKLRCSNCGKEFFYSNYILWILNCPFHWFGKRLTKCPRCKTKNWIKRIK